MASSEYVCRDVSSCSALGDTSPIMMALRGGCMHLAQLQRLQPQHHLFLHSEYPFIEHPS